LKFLFFFVVSFFSIFSQDSIFISTDKVFLSPNNDGKNDTMKFKIDFNVNKKILDWNFSIYDESSKLVKLFSADKRHENRKNFISSFFVKDEVFLETEIPFPKEILWIGNDSNGKSLSDGRYSYQMKIIFSDKSETISPLTTIYLDSVSPYAKLSSENKFFTPNNDKVFDTVLIKQDIFAEPQDRWTATIYNKAKFIVKTFSWDTRSIPKILSWDGKDDRGILQENGEYTYELIGEDFSENKFRSKLDSIYLSRGLNNLDIQSNLSEFSPNGDKLKDTVQFKIIGNEKNISKWEISIFSKQKEETEIHKTFSGTNILETLVWNGKNSKEKILPDGLYFYNAKFFTASKTIQSPTRNIEINTKDKSIYFETSPKGFTPDSDSIEDLLEIKTKFENIDFKTWKLSVVQKYKTDGVDKKIVIKKWKGVGTPAEKIYWDGFSDSGILIGSYNDFELHFSFRNSLNEIKFFKVGEFRSGLLLNSTPGKLRLSIPEYIVKQDEDDILSSMKSIIKKFPGYKVEIQSHSKQSGNNLDNMTKTEMRAKSIYKKLFGIEKDFGRFTYRGFGEVEPFFTDDTKFNQEKNDRLDILFIEPKIISR
jgi:flagellar hook assembly protein FlgD